MHLENGQKQKLGQNLRGFMKAKNLTLNSLSQHGISWTTADYLTKGKVKKYITTGLTERLEKLTGKSMGALITDDIVWSATPLRKTDGRGGRAAEPMVDPEAQGSTRKMFVIEYRDGTEVVVPAGMKITITGPSSIKIG